MGAIYTSVFGARHQMLDKEKRQEVATAKKTQHLEWLEAEATDTISRYKYAQGSDGKTNSPKRTTESHPHVGSLG
jgi:hypothetical protein